MGLLDSLAKGAKGVGAAIQQGVGRIQEADTLRMHRRRLEEAAGAKPREAPPEIAGERTPSGFTQKAGGRPGIAISIVGGFFALVLLAVVFKGFSDFGRPGWTAGNTLIMVLTFIFFGGFIGSFLYLVGRQELARWMTTGELTVERWPVRPGEQCAVRYRASSRGNRAVTTVRAELRCSEYLTYRDSDSRSNVRRQAVRSEKIGEATPTPGPDGSIAVTWKMQVPPDAAPSFHGGTSGVDWEIVVHLGVEGTPDSSQDFPLRVVPVTA